VWGFAGRSSRGQKWDFLLVRLSERYRVGQVSKLNMDQLKAFLRAQRLPVSGKKGDLVARVKKHFGIADEAPEGEGEGDAAEAGERKPAHRAASRRAARKEELEDDDR